MVPDFAGMRLTFIQFQERVVTSLAAQVNICGVKATSGIRARRKTQRTSVRDSGSTHMVLSSVPSEVVIDECSHHWRSVSG
jgi:hypothetical protein